MVDGLPGLARHARHPPRARLPPRPPLEHVVGGGVAQRRHRGARPRRSPRRTRLHVRPAALEATRERLPRDQRTPSGRSRRVRDDRRPSDRRRLRCEGRRHARRVAPQRLRVPDVGRDAGCGDRSSRRVTTAAAQVGWSLKRCAWASREPLITYHDEEWGAPSHDDRVLFEFLILEGAQAGLSWDTILGKRAGYRRAFDGFDPRKVARYDAKKVRALLADPGIVRNRLKIASAITNARAFLAVQQEARS